MKILFRVNIAAARRAGFESPPPTVVLDVDPARLTPEHQNWLAQTLHAGCSLGAFRTKVGTRYANFVRRKACVEDACTHIVLPEPTLEGLVRFFAMCEEALKEIRSKVQAYDNKACEVSKQILHDPSLAVIPATDEEGSLEVFHGGQLRPVQNVPPESWSTPARATAVAYGMQVKKEVEALLETRLAQIRNT